MFKALLLLTVVGLSLGRRPTEQLNNWIDCVNNNQTRNITARLEDCLQRLTSDDVQMCNPYPDCQTGRQNVLDNLRRYSLDRLRDFRVADISRDFTHGDRGASRHVVGTGATDDGCLLQSSSFVRIQTQDNSDQLASIEIFGDRNLKIQQANDCGLQAPERDDDNQRDRVRRLAESVVQAFSVRADDNKNQDPVDRLNQQVRQVISDNVQLCDPYPDNCVQGQDQVQQLYRNRLNQLNLREIRPSENTRITTSRDSALIEFDAFSGSTRNGCLFANQATRLLIRQDQNDANRANTVQWLYTDNNQLQNDLNECRQRAK